MNPRKWIISVPFGFETGGPEALHQLCHTLRENNQEAGRLGTYQYLDMDMAIASALTVYKNQILPRLLV